MKIHEYTVRDHFPKGQTVSFDPSSGKKQFSSPSEGSLPYSCPSSSSFASLCPIHHSSPSPQLYSLSSLNFFRTFPSQPLHLGCIPDRESIRIMSSWNLGCFFSSSSHVISCICLFYLLTCTIGNTEWKILYMLHHYIQFTALVPGNYAD